MMASPQLAPAEYAGEVETRRRLRGFFQKYPQKTFSKKQIKDHFNDVTEFNLQHHLGSLRKAGVIFSEKRGVYQLDKGYQTIQEKREAVAAHSAANPRLTQDDTPFSPSTPALTVVENPSSFNELARLWASGFEERLRKLPDQFTEADMTFFLRMRDRAFSLPK